MVEDDHSFSFIYYFNNLSIIKKGDQANPSKYGYLQKCEEMIYFL